MTCLVHYRLSCLYDDLVLEGSSAECGAGGPDRHHGGRRQVRTKHSGQGPRQKKGTLADNFATIANGLSVLKLF